MTNEEYISSLEGEQDRLRQKLADIRAVLDNATLIDGPAALTRIRDIIDGDGAILPLSAPSPDSQCIYVANGERCDQEALHDVVCSTHLIIIEQTKRVREEIVNLLYEFDGVASKEIITDEIMNRIVGREFDNFAGMYIAQSQSARLNARMQSKRAMDVLVARALLRKQVEKETRLRSDFGELAKDLKEVVRHLAPPLGGDQHPVHGRWLMELHSWRATAEILADKELSDNLDEVRKAPIEDFGPVPRPQATDDVDVWRCPCHGNVGSIRYEQDTAYCAERDCSHNSEESG